MLQACQHIFCTLLWRKTWNACTTEGTENTEEFKYPSVLPRVLCGEGLTSSAFAALSSRKFSITLARNPMKRDPIELEIFKNLYHSIAEEMGAALRRTAFSPNIKERRDYSCAVFDARGEVIAMGDHMPVHLGSMPMSVRAAIAHCELAPGDMVMLNDPFSGGTHLPDITLVAPVFVEKVRARRTVFPRSRFLRRLARPPCRRRRDLSGLDGPLPRDLPGRVPHSSRKDHARRRDWTPMSGICCWPMYARPGSARAISERRSLPATRAPPA